jgi:putative endonuclease
MIDDTLSTGIQGEEVACRFLAGKGYRILDRNWRSGHCELDIIARTGDTIVFCEVKTARNHRYGSAIEWVTPRKVRHIAQAALSYIVARQIHGCCFRFDVIGLDVRDGDMEITHIENAFSAPGGV